jgi:hypothetical protein
LEELEDALKRERDRSKIQSDKLANTTEDLALIQSKLIATDKEREDLLTRNSDLTFSNQELKELV